MTEFVDLRNAEGRIQKPGVALNDRELYPEFYLPIAVGIIFNGLGKVLTEKRALTIDPQYNPSEIAHVAGIVKSGETPEETIEREGFEEAGIRPFSLRVVDQGILSQNRYRYLLAGQANAEPFVRDPEEVDWVKFMTLEELKVMHVAGKEIFIPHFFEDLQLAVSARSN